MPFRELASVRSKYERNVGIFRAAKTKSFLKQYLPWRVGYVFFSSNHMRNAHLIIINYDGEVIQRLFERLCYYHVSKFSRIEFDRPSDKVLERNLLVRIPETHHFLTLSSSFF